MSSGRYYPKQFIINVDRSFSEENIISSSGVWRLHRGFAPKNPLISGNYLVINIYSLDNRHITYQLRDTTTDETDRKYSLLRTVYDPLVKTDTEELSGPYVITESTMDCILLREQGINALCLLGLKKYRIIKALELIEGEPFCYCLNNDLAGTEAERLHFRNKGIKLSFDNQFKDLNEMLIQSKPKFDSFIEMTKSMLQL